MRNLITLALCLAIAFVGWEIVDPDGADRFADSVASNVKALRRDN